CRQRGHRRFPRCRAEGQAPGGRDTSVLQGGAAEGQGGAAWPRAAGRAQNARGCDLRSDSGRCRRLPRQDAGAPPRGSAGLREGARPDAVPAARGEAQRGLGPVDQRTLRERDHQDPGRDRSRRQVIDMSIQRTPMTREGHNRLKEELDRLKRIERPAISRSIAEARAHGDLSENAEYHAAREKQSLVEARINDLESKVGAAEVIEPPTSGDRVTFGSTVRLEDEAGKETKYQIVGSEGADPAHPPLPLLAPPAPPLTPQNLRHPLSPHLPGGKKSFEILEANFPWAEQA